MKQTYITEYIDTIILTFTRHTVYIGSNAIPIYTQHNRTNFLRKVVNINKYWSHTIPHSNIYLQALIALASAKIACPQIYESILMLLNSKNLLEYTFCNNNIIPNISHLTNNMVNLNIDKGLYYANPLDTMDIMEFIYKGYIHISIDHLLPMNKLTSTYDVLQKISLIQGLNDLLPSHWIVKEVFYINTLNTHFITQELDSLDYLTYLENFVIDFPNISPIFSICLGLTNVLILLSYNTLITC